MAISGLVGIVVESMESQQGSRTIGESTTSTHGLPDEQGQKQRALESVLADSLRNLANHSV